MIADTVGGVCRLVTGTTPRWQCDPDAGGARVYFANHASHLDVVVIWASLPPAARARVRPVAGKDYWERGAIRRLMSTRVFDAVLIERGGAGAAGARASLASMAAALERGSSPIVFPEGTRSGGGSLGGFKSGLYYLSRRCPGVDMVPVFVDNTHRILPKGEALPVPMLTSVVFGAPLRAADGEDKAAFLARARAALGRLGGRDGRTN